MEFRGLPAAKSVEQAILLAQLQILRRMRGETQERDSGPDRDDGQVEPVLPKPEERQGASWFGWLRIQRSEDGWDKS